MSEAQLQQAAPWLTFTVPGNPRPKKRPRVTANGVYTESAGAELVVAWEAKAALQGRQPTVGLVRVDAVFFMGTRRRSDIDNTLKLLMDAANGVVWADDSQVVELHVYKRVDRENPRTEVEVREVTA